ncbi:hypothetical protein COEREDRAFT_98767 [Coemansia reversa NRRL 1564]|uniref:ERCC4 domain-containing protein n=1 Tax=Coemansia reversa (strain ATCC 12441 / NRRL 1564) TaxID=763665 RepID=A0A2G5B6G8_COERN|nr:hypothetical protein COEREDRAFT_98767 [Coemansia reversa NRRL 1564]|eukprot:PIA14598.1 hypothetical protein COEREDRAFT_98767 [Coemansia reversa NRRL 1564]
MAAQSGTEIIELLSDDSSDDGIGAGSSQASRLAAAERYMTTPTRVISSSGERAALSRPAIHERPIEVATPNTPDLPSPSMLLGARKNLSPSPTRIISRQEALDLPSSPPLMDGGEVDIFEHSVENDTESSPPAPPQYNIGAGYTSVLEISDDDCQILDDIINAQESQSTEDLSQFLDSSTLGPPRVFGRRSAIDHAPAMADFSDAIATDILGSSSSSEISGEEDEAEETSSDDVYSNRAKELLARAALLTKSLQCPGRDTSTPRLHNRRAHSADNEAVSVSTFDTSPLPSALNRPPKRATYLGSSSDLLHSSGSSSSVHIPWRTESELAVVSCSQAVTQKELQKNERARESERRRHERNMAKERRAKEKEFAKGVSIANRKTVDAREIARDMTLLVDPGVLQLLPKPKKASSSVSIDTTGPGGTGSGDEDRICSNGGGDCNTTTAEVDHAVFLKLKEEGIAHRISDEDSSTACAVRWEMRMRRKWDSRLGLYVPLDPPHTISVRRAAIVVFSGTRLIELIGGDRLPSLLGLWRASLDVERLFVVVLGLQRLLRESAMAETREFARQMRSYIRDADAELDSDTSGVSKRRTKNTCQNAAAAGVTEESAEEAILKLQITCPWVIWFTRCSNDARALGQLLWQTTVDIALAEFNGGNAAEAAGSSEPLPLASQSASSSDMPREFITGEVAASLNAAVVRSGTDLADSWQRALTQIPKVTQPVAQSIAFRYPTPHNLFSAWQQQTSLHQREQMLADISVASAVAGGRRLGPVMSARIYRLFNEIDPTRPFAEL